MGHPGSLAGPSDRTCCRIGGFGWCLIDGRVAVAGVLESRGIAESHDAFRPYELAGTWQGTLGSGQEMRVVIQITKETRGEYRALA